MVLVPFCAFSRRHNCHEIDSLTYAPLQPLLYRRFPGVAVYPPFKLRFVWIMFADPRFRIPREHLQICLA